MNYLFEPMPVVGLPIAGGDSVFPVRRVYCVGRNYAAHAREMGADPEREPPFFFCKPNDGQSIVPVPPGVPVALPYPSQTEQYHHEVELVVAIGQGGCDIAVADASQHVFGYAVGLDMTRRDLQTRMREHGRPWEVGKAFDYSAPVGLLHPVAEVGVMTAGAIGLTCNGAVRQNSNIDQMIWPVAAIIAHLSRLFELRPGDLIFTGTPEGVGAVQPGDVLVAQVAKLAPIEVHIV